MKSKILLLLVVALMGACSKFNNQKRSEVQNKYVDGAQFTFSKATLLDKIKGGWAGQVIGCTYGGPTEFRYLGTMIQDYIKIEWDSTRMEWYYLNAPGLYDDIYMDLTFVEVFEKEGLSATAESHAKAFANAEYKLWHANQAARNNILNGIMPPLSGFWKNNPHADDIDFQIESDFAGLMTPGMINVATGIADKVGHIMNYGDGWYGGVYAASMYSLAFVSNDVNFIVTEALKTIPKKSTFYKCINDVINWHKQYPNDWKQAWSETQKKWSSDVGCPNGVYSIFDIDAKINAAYMVIGLLYGNGDYGKTIDISTRCGQDSDCNPASVGGILGCMLGYNNIPDFWKQGLNKVEDLDFKYTDMSLNDVYKIGMKHALLEIKNNNGNIDNNSVTVVYNTPKTVKYEKAFDGLYPVLSKDYGRDEIKISSENKTYEFEFEGTGFVISGNAQKIAANADASLKVDAFIDGKFVETIKMPTNFINRRLDIFWNYDLPKGKHKVKIVQKKSSPGYWINVTKALAYSDETILFNY